MIRPGLIGAMDSYLEALARNDPNGLPLAPDVRFTENAVPLPLGKGLWATATGVPDHDYVHVTDDELGQVGWIGVVEEGGRPTVVFVRLAVRDGLIHEVETIVRRARSRLYDPGNMTAPREIVFTEVSPAQQSSRDELVAIANRYFDGIVAVDGDLIPVTDDASRFENGTQTAHVTDPAGGQISQMGIRAQINSGYFAYIADIRDRRVVAVDTTRGLVMLVVVFDHPARLRSVPVQGVGEVELPPYHRSPNSVLIGELFKVRAGQIVHIEAVLDFVPFGTPTGWE